MAKKKADSVLENELDAKLEQIDTEVVVTKKPSPAGVVEIRMVNPKRTGSVTVRDYTDPETGLVKKFLDSNGLPRVKKYTKALTVLNLKNEDNRLEYLHVKDHPLYVKGPNPLLKVVDVTKEAIERTANREASIDAMIVARRMRGEKLVDFARVLGINTLNVLEEVIKDKVYDHAESMPEDFLAHYNDPNRMFKEVLHRGRMKSVFTNKNDIWKFRDVIMGSNIDEAILWLKNNEDLMPSIRKEISNIEV